MKSIYQDLDPVARAKAIEALADGTETLRYNRQLSREELDEYRENLTDVMVQKSEIENELASIKEEYKHRLKPVNGDLNLLFSIVKSKSIEVNEECFKIPNYDENMMEFYNSEGVMIESRRLKPEERQTSIKEIKFNQF